MEDSSRVLFYLNFTTQDALYHKKRLFHHKWAEEIGHLF